MRHSIPTFLVLFVLFFSGPSSAQPCNSSSIQKGFFQTRSVFVVGVIVHDKKGKSVEGLPAADFTVLADDKPQSVVDFHSIAPTYSTCTGIVVDRSGSRRDIFPNAEFGPIENFAASNLDNNHGAFVVAFKDHPIPVPGYATSSAELGQELKYVESIELYGMTARNDAIELAAQGLANAPGYRILLFVGEGDDNHSKSTSKEAIESALKAHATVYVIQLQSDSSNIETRNASEFTKKIVAATGGEVFSVHKKDDIEKAFTALKEDLANMYLVGFSPNQLQEKTEFHKLRISTKQKGLRVIAPTKFYLPK